MTSIHPSGAGRVSVEADAYLALVHEVRQYREAEQFPNVVPEFHLRKGVITARDPTTYTCSVLIGAADQTTLEPELVQPIPGIRLADTVYPKVGATCFVAFNGPEPTVLFTVGSPVGACRAWRGTNLSVTQGTEVVVPLTADYDDTDDLHTTANFNRIIVGWPGRYAGGATGEWDAATTTGVRRLVSVRLVRPAGSVYIARHEDQHAASGNPMTQHCSFENVVMAAGDAIEMVVYQGGTGALFLNSFGEYTPIMELRWQGPP